MAEVNISLRSYYIFNDLLFLGLAFDSWDMDFYMDLFVNKLKRDPTSVELFDLAQSNSEHSRHWFFKVKYIMISFRISKKLYFNVELILYCILQGKILLDGKEIDESLIDMVASTQKSSNNNNVIKFGDNSRLVYLRKYGFNGTWAFS